MQLESWILATNIIVSRDTQVLKCKKKHLKAVMLFSSRDSFVTEENVFNPRYLSAQYAC